MLGYSVIEIMELHQKIKNHNQNYPQNVLNLPELVAALTSKKDRRQQNTDVVALFNRRIGHMERSVIAKEDSIYFKPAQHNRDYSNNNAAISSGTFKIVKIHGGVQVKIKDGKVTELIPIVSMSAAKAGGSSVCKNDTAAFNAITEEVTKADPAAQVLSYNNTQNTQRKVVFQPYYGEALDKVLQLPQFTTDPNAQKNKITLIENIITAYQSMVTKNNGIPPKDIKAANLLVAPNGTITFIDYTTNATTYASQSWVLLYEQQLPAHNKQSINRNELLLRHSMFELLLLIISILDNHHWQRFISRLSGGFIKNAAGSYHLNPDHLRDQLLADIVCYTSVQGDDNINNESQHYSMSELLEQAYMVNSKLLTIDEIKQALTAIKSSV